jgi:hypothetical protein
MSQDRNQIARQQFAERSQNAAIKRALDQFAGDFQLGRAGALDRFGNMVREGDHVLFKMPNDPVMRVVEVTPSMDPSHPVGAIKMVLQCEVPVIFAANQPSQNMVRIGSASTIAAAEARVAQAQEAAGPHNGTGQEHGHVQQPEADAGEGDAGDGDSEEDSGDPGDPGDQGD